jgi:hypothetical protein
VFRPSRSETVSGVKLPRKALVVGWPVEALGMICGVVGQWRTASVHFPKCPFFMALILQTTYDPLLIGHDQYF